jgi:hypothetical protein
VNDGVREATKLGDALFVLTVTRTFVKATP